MPASRRLVCPVVALALCCGVASLARGAPGDTELISVVGSVPSSAKLSANGRYVAFVSSAYNLVANDTNHRADVFVRDLQTATIERVSVPDDSFQSPQE